MIAEGVMRINIWPFIRAPLALNFPVTIPPHETASATVPSSHNLSGKDPLHKGSQVLPSPWALPRADLQPLGVHLMQSKPPWAPLAGWLTSFL